MATLVVLALLLLAAFPFGLFRERIEAALERRFGAPVSIAGVERLSGLSFRPVVRLADLRVAQPAWAGPGDLAVVRDLRARVSVWRLITGQSAIADVVVAGATLNLVRDAGGRANWEGRERADGGGGPELEALVVRDSRLTLRDARRGMSFAATLSADPRGVRLAGAGGHRGRPLGIAFNGGPVRPGPWPFRVELASPLLRFAAVGRTAQPVNLDLLSADMRASAVDARRLDDVIEAGLPGTQPVRLAARVVRADGDWTVERMTGAVGRSTFTGRLTVRKREERTVLRGAVDFAGLDFDDLATDAQLARAAAKRAMTGPRVISETPINFEKLGTIDGTVRVTARRLLFRRPSLFRSFSATVTMDRRLLTVRPLTAGLEHGRLTGFVTVDHRSGQPKLALDLRVTGGRLEDLLGGTVALAPLDARIVLAGTGLTARSALAGARGRIGLASRGGTLDRRYAVFGGGDVLKGVGAALGGNDERVALRCVVGRFSGSAGRLAAGPLTVDSAVSGAIGSGTLALGTERIELAFDGRSKKPGLIQSTLPIRITGTFSEPHIRLIPLEAEGRGVLGKLGGYLKGLRVRGDDDVRPAPAVDCARQTAAALR